MSLISRSRDAALPAELGHDVRPEGSEPAPAHLQHEPETVDREDVPPFERCPHCEWSAPIGRIDPYAACPARVRENDVYARADRAESDDQQASLSDSTARADGGERR